MTNKKPDAINLDTINLDTINQSSISPDNMRFEESLTELDAIVTQLEQGDLALDESLKQFERGIALARASQTKLTSAEQRIQILLQNSDDASLETFQPTQHFDDDLF